MGDLVRHGAQQEPLGPRHSLVADDDQVRLLSSATSRIASAGSPRRANFSDLHAGGAREFGGGLERRLNVLLRVDRPLHVLGRIAALGAQPGLGTGS